MDCDMAAWVLTAHPGVARTRLAMVKAFMMAMEDRLSRFRPHSELSRLNARASQVVPVSPWLWEVLLCALEGAQRTGGLYDPTVLDALEAAGYDRTFHEMADDDRPPRPLAPSRKDWRAIRLDPDGRCVTLPPGVRLDFGGIAKGWAAERAADLLAPLGPSLVDAGGDIAVRGNLPGLSGWPIGVADPREASKDLTLLLVSDRGVATSGVDYRRWQRGGMVQHHIIDPHRRRPAETDLLSVTVVAPNAMQADLHALVALLLGSEAGWQYLTRQRDVEGLLIHEDGIQLASPGFQQYVQGSEGRRH